ncbi:lipopolysaccharide biosynthesis protein [Clostridium thermarum]|uniref:lipopolysaccharide biosynthesis protein n=1 Tax=Clostridium thermarum TaxID=1716543 RepID=UPI0013D4586A|nr:lipopolysaccharide biosynthesis protein [Clostridium thermarum]
MENKSKLKKGIFVTFIARYSNIIAQLLINSILARILSPDEFGVIVIIMVFISFFNILGDMGIGPAIIQNKSLDDKEISDIFKFSIFGAVILSLLFYLFSYFISIFYMNKIYIRLGFILSFSVFFYTCNIVPNSLIYKQQNFKLVGLINISTNIVVEIITIFLAINGFSYYSLAIDSVLKSIVLFILCYKFSKLKVEKTFSIDSLKKIKSYSGYQFLFNFVNYFTRNLDNILIGKFLGVITLGNYDKSYKLMLYPVQYLTNVITPVLHPVLSEFQNKIEVIYETYIKVVKILANLGIFITIYCFFASSEIIRIVYGDKWVDAIPIFKILSLSIVIQTVLSSIGSIFQATGYVDKLFSTGIISACFTVTSVLIGIICKMINILAIGLVISFILNFFVCFYVLITKVFNKKFREFLFIFVNVIINGLVMVCALLLTGHMVIENIFTSAFVKLVIGLTAYLIGMFLTKEYKYILQYDPLVKESCNKNV